MRKINNAYTQIEGYNCFGCSPDNQIGLKMEFYETEDGVMAQWTPTRDYEGYYNHLHGGIQATLLDEVGSWIVPTKLGSSGVTRTITVNYHKSVFINQGMITIKAQLISFLDNIALVKAQIEDNEGTPRATATIEYFVFPEDVARKRFYFPGKEQF